MKHIKHHSAAYRAVSACVLLMLTAAIFINRRVQRWMMT
jgi:hypothetical protein